MSERPLDLPDFERPPVVEVALSVQFEPVEGLGVPQIGLLWSAYRDRFPKTREEPPLHPVVERFGAPAVQQARVELRFVDVVPSRVLMLSNDESQLIQVQRDRFIHNWRAQGGPYPRYESVRDTFFRELQVFRDFLIREHLGEVVPNQCEATYVNRVVAEGSLWTRHGQLGAIVKAVDAAPRFGFLPEPETMRMAGSYLIQEPSIEGPLGRLHISVEPRFQDEQPFFQISLTARGRPTGPDFDGVKRFIDVGREWIVKGFTDFTTDAMHKVWRRTR